MEKRECRVCVLDAVTTFGLVIIHSDSGSRQADDIDGSHA